MLVLGGVLVTVGAVSVAIEDPDVAPVSEAHAAVAEPVTETAAWSVRFRYAGGQAGRDAVDSAIDEATEDMNVLVRGIARRRLRDANPVITELGFSLDGDPLRASYVEGRVVESPADGTTVDWVDQYGDTVHVSQKFSGNKLVQHMSDDNGSRKNVYRFASDGGKMTMSVEIRSKMLPQPVRYDVSYRAAK